jgi:hypothetical protein
MHEVFEQLLFGAHYIAQRVPQSNVALYLEQKILAAHCAPPGQGIATFDNDPRSSLAYTPVLTSERCPKISAISLKAAPWRAISVARV